MMTELGAMPRLRANRFGRAVLSSAGSGLGTLLLRLLSIALLSRLVGTEAFGFYFLGQSVALVCSVVGNLSTSYKVMESGSLSLREFWSCVAVPVLLTALLTGSLGLAADAVSPGYLLALLGVSGLAVAASGPAMSALRTAEALGRRCLAFRNLAWAEIWSTLVGFFVCAPILALVGHPALALVAGHWAYVLTKLALILRHNLGALPSALDQGTADPPRSGRMSAYGLEVLDLASVHALRLIIGAMFGPTVAALWSRGSQLVLLAVNLLVQPIAYVLVPLGLRDRSRRQHLAERAPQVIDNLSILLLPVALSVFVLSEEIAVVLLGQGWLETDAYLRAFSLLLLGRTVQRAFGILGRATQTSGVRLAIDAGTLAGFAVAVVALVQSGPLTAAWAFSVACCVAALLHFVYGSTDRRFVPWRFAGTLAAYVVGCVGFVYGGGMAAPLVWKLACTAAIWLVLGALCGASAWISRPLLAGDLLLEFTRKMDHQTIR